jgi:Zn-dependent M28 family amino/carboxypeptidase
MKKIIPIVALIATAAVFFIPYGFTNGYIRENISFAATSNDAIADGFAGDGANAFTRENTSFAAALSDAAANSPTYRRLLDFAEKNPKREAGTAGGDAAAEYLAAAFESLEYLPYVFEASEKTVDERGGMEFEFNENGEVRAAKNVVFYKPSSGENRTKKQVVIGAHYDNTVYEKSSENGGIDPSFGASDNATGIAVLLTLAEALKGDGFDGFDLVFAAFSAEEKGLIGSSFFVEKMSAREIENTLLFINLDCVGGGDYLYLYVDEMKRAHGDFFMDKAKTAEVDLKMMPRGRVALFGDLYSGLPYLSYGMMSDHAPFFKAGVNVAFFTSANYEITDSFAPRESKDRPNIVNTEDDTLENYVKYYGGSGFLVGDGLVGLIASALLSDGFIEAASVGRPGEGFYEVLYSYAFYVAAYAAGASVLALIAYLVYRRVKGVEPETTDDGEKKVDPEDIVVFDEFGI